MSFRSGGYATVWDVQPVRNTVTKVRVSSSRKNKDTGEYEQDFSGFVSFLGTAAAGDAAKLKPRDRIKFGDVEVRNTYDKEKKVTYWNCNCFSFEKVQNNNSSSNASGSEDVDNDEFLKVPEGAETEAPLPW